MEYELEGLEWVDIDFPETDEDWERGLSEGYGLGEVERFDYNRISFVAIGSIKTSISIEFGFSGKLGGIGGVDVNANFINMELGSGKIDLTDPLNPESYTGDYAGKNGNSKFSHSISATGKILNTPVAIGDYIISHSSNSSEVNTDGGLYFVTPITETSSRKLGFIGPLENSIKKPNAKAKTGKKGDFYGIDIGVVQLVSFLD